MRSGSAEWVPACSEICGYPRIVHGGLTAAVVDECLGFLMFALKHQRALPFWGPAYTVHLEIDYKNVSQPIPALGPRPEVTLQFMY